MSQDRYPRGGAADLALCVTRQVTTADALQGRRPQWGAGRRWEGNYLSSVQENPNTAGYVQAVSQLRAKDRFQKVPSHHQMYKSVGFHGHLPDIFIAVKIL